MDSGDQEEVDIYKLSSSDDDNKFENQVNTNTFVGGSSLSSTSDARSDNVASDFHAIDIAPNGDDDDDDDDDDDEGGGEAEDSDDDDDDFDGEKEEMLAEGEEGDDNENDQEYVMGWQNV